MLTVRPRLTSRHPIDDGAYSVLPAWGRKCDSIPPLDMAFGTSRSIKAPRTHYSAATIISDLIVGVPMVAFRSGDGSQPI